MDSVPTPAAANAHPAAADLLRAPAQPELLEADPDPPAFADRSFNHLHPNSVFAERIGNVIFSAVIAAGALAAFLIMLFANGLELMTWLVLGAGLALAGFLLALGLLLPRKAWQNTTYAISDLGLEIRRGIWWKHSIDVPRSRIQHTDVQQGPLARSLGLGKLVVYTAGTEHAAVTLDGLEHERALQMRDFLLRGGEDDAV